MDGEGVPGAVVPNTCRHEGICGGCGLQHLPYVEQLWLKSRALLERLPRAERPAAVSASLFLPVFDPESGGPWHFRQKVAFVFGVGADGRELVMGHYARGSQRVVPVAECPVHSARANRIAFALRDALRHARMGAAGASGSGVLRHLIVRVTRDDRQAIAMLVVSRNDKRLKKPIRSLLESSNRPDGFYLNIHDGPGPYMVGKDTIRIDGHAQVRERVGGTTFLVSPTAFFQTNVRAAEALQALVLEWMSAVPRTDGVHGARAPQALSGYRILDLYTGSGLFALPLAAAGAHVVGVEENRAAVHDAEANRRANKLPSGRMRFIAARVEHALTRLASERWDAVVLDPPRSGCPTRVLDQVFGRITPPHVVYVSCNPDALSTELPTIRSHGYRVDDVRAVDMFPHTAHIEAVVRFARR